MCNQTPWFFIGPRFHGHQSQGTIFYQVPMDNFEPSCLSWIKTAFEPSGPSAINQFSRSSLKAVFLKTASFSSTEWCWTLRMDGTPAWPWSSWVGGLMRGPALTSRGRSHSMLGSHQLTPPRPTPSINEKLCFLTMITGAGPLWGPPLVAASLLKLSLRTSSWSLCTGQHWSESPVSCDLG